jgi:hypothetical protein
LALITGATAIGFLLASCSSSPTTPSNVYLLPNPTSATNIDVQISAELSSPSSAARLKSAGDNELVEVDSLVAQARQLASHLAANHDADYAVEMSRLTDLVSATASAKATIIAAMAALSQSPTSTTLANVRSALIQLRSPLGKIAEAKADASEIVALLNGG